MYEARQEHAALGLAASLAEGRVAGAPDPEVGTPPASAAESAQALGLMRLGSTLLALPVAHLREVIACPPALSALPVEARGLCGAVTLRGAVIPVLDLATVLGVTVPEPGAVIVLMRHTDRVLGLRVSAVAGMAHVAGRALHLLDVLAPAGHAIATHSFETEQGVATLLDAARIAALPGVPMVAETQADTQARSLGPREPLLLFDCGGLPLGIAALHVEATVSRTVLRDSPLKRGLCVGVIDHHGFEVPVIDTLQLLGLGGEGMPQESAAVVLRHPRGRLAMTLDAVRDIARVPAADILPLSPLGLARPALFRGLLPGAPGQQHLLIDADALQADEVLASLASLSRPIAQRAGGPAGNTPSGAAAARESGGLPYLTYDVEVETASPLTQVREIVTYPESVLPLAGGRDATLGLFTHRGMAVPLICLATLLGRPAQLNVFTARVLLVEDGQRVVGLVVQALRSIESARWEQPRAADGSPGRSDRQPLIEVGQGTLRRTLPRLDLQQLLCTLGAAAPAASEAVAA